MRKILILLADQWRWDAIGPLGSLAHTPNIDRLVARGTTFTNHVTVTVPCGPSRASLLTGLYTMTHRSVITGTPLDERFDNLALAVRRASIERSWSATPRRRPIRARRRARTLAFRSPATFCRASSLSHLTMLRKTPTGLN